MNRVTVKPDMLQWARERANLSIADLERRFPKLELWERGEFMPTLKQLERFAKATHVPIGHLFLSAPPVERVPIPDFRTLGNERLQRPSPNLLDTIYLCQQRQSWYRDFSISTGADPYGFVGSVRIEADAVTTASRIRNDLGFSLEEQRKARTWEGALRCFIEGAEALGLLVMVSGVVGNNTHRKLDPEEFRGFALADDRAPLIFINGGDTKAAQMFTLAHELVHIWLGRSALSDLQITSRPEQALERWCNQVAAELLVPIAVLRSELQADQPLLEEAQRLARIFKVSTLVVLRRIYDAGGLTYDELWSAYQRERARLLALVKGKGSGGNFYRTQPVRVSRRFASALIASTLEGHTLYRDALRLLGIKKTSTFQEMGESLGVI